MKKAVLFVVAIAMFALVMVSCNNHTCPAYSCNDQAEQVENLN